MPSITVATALGLAHAQGGIPWDIDSWKEITGVSHGLFPEDDSNLPLGISRADANDISTYFDVLSKKATQEQQIQFSRAKDRYTGRSLWNKWVGKKYAAWRIHDMAVKAMTDSSCHPHMIMQADELDTWPDTSIVANLAQPGLGLALFGTDGLTSLNMVKPSLRVLVNAITFRTVDVLKTRFNRICTKAKHYRERAEKAYLGKFWAYFPNHMCY